MPPSTFYGITRVTIVPVYASYTYTLNFAGVDATARRLPSGENATHVVTLSLHRGAMRTLARCVRTSHTLTVPLCVTSAMRVPSGENLKFSIGS